MQEAGGFQQVLKRSLEQGAHCGVLEITQAKFRQDACGVKDFNLLDENTDFVPHSAV